MSGESTVFDELIAETRELDAAAFLVQGERSLNAEPAEIEGLVDQYNHWYAEALAVIPGELEEKFRDLYEGGLVVKRIKAFLEAPGAKNVLFSEDAEVELVSYWQHPFESTFHSSLLEQRQLLTVAKQMREAKVSSAEIDLVVQMGRGLPDLIQALQHRHAGRDPYVVTDEYDVQDLVGGVLRMIFEDVRPEDPAPTRAGGSSRVDFLLKRQGIVVETKMTRPNLTDRELGNQLTQDIERYRSHPECRALVAIVYDPERRIRNPRGLEDDLSGNREGIAVRVAIAG